MATRPLSKDELAFVHRQTEWYNGFRASLARHGSTLMRKRLYRKRDNEGTMLVQGVHRTVASRALTFHAARMASGEEYMHLGAMGFEACVEIHRKGYE